MKAMGWAEHQVLYVAHNDARHPHLHLIINRVHPDTGRALNDWQERRRAQVWAHDYERQQGAILCPARDARGVKPAKTGLPHRDARLLNGCDDAARRRIARQSPDGVPARLGRALSPPARGARVLRSPCPHR
jgi:hypothetical protein